MIYFKTGIRIAFCLSLLTLVPVRSMAQDNDDFSPDAPGATTGVGIMPQGKIDWETGFSHEWNRRNGAHERMWTINTSMFRLGLTPQAELRMQIDECLTHTSEGSYGGIANAAIGTKIKIYEGERGYRK